MNPPPAAELRGTTFTGPESAGYSGALWPSNLAPQLGLLSRIMAEQHRHIMGGCAAARVYLGRREWHEFQDLMEPMRAYWVPRTDGETDTQWHGLQIIEVNVPSYFRLEGHIREYDAPTRSKLARLRKVETDLETAIVERTQWQTAANHFRQEADTLAEMVAQLQRQVTEITFRIPVEDHQS